MSVMLLPTVCDAKWGCKLSTCFGGFLFLICTFDTLCMEDNLCTSLHVFRLFYVLSF